MEELMWLFIWQYKRKFVLSIDMTIQKLVYIFILRFKNPSKKITTQSYRKILSTHDYSGCGAVIHSKTIDQKQFVLIKSCVMTR